MKIEENKIFTSPSDLNNFTLCKYHIKNDKLSFTNKLLKRKPKGDLELVIELGLKHEKKHLNLMQIFQALEMLSNYLQMELNWENIDLMIQVKVFQSI